MNEPVKSPKVTSQTPPVAVPTPSGENGLAVASMVLGITSVTFMGPITGIPAVILGIISLKNPVNRGYSITGIITGSISIVLTVLAIILFILLIGFGAALSGSAESSDMHHDGSNMAPHTQTFQKS